MQLAELFRRGVVAPLTDEAAEELAQWSSTATSQVDFLPISTDALFQQIWSTGVFQEMNRACSSMIDDYEEEDLQPDVLRTALDVLDAKTVEVEEIAVKQFLLQLTALCKSALNRNHPVYFVL